MIRCSKLTIALLFFYCNSTFYLNLNHIKWKPNRHTNSLISGLCSVLAWVSPFGLSPNRPWIQAFRSRFSTTAITTAITWMGVHLLAIVSSYTTLLCRFISRRRILPDYRAPVFPSDFAPDALLRIRTFGGSNRRPCSFARGIHTQRTIRSWMWVKIIYTFNNVYLDYNRL